MSVKAAKDTCLSRSLENLISLIAFMVCFQIFFTHEGKRWGLRTLEQLPARAFVGEYVGEILTNMEQEDRNNNAKADLTKFFTHEEKGWGLRTLEQLPAGAFACEYVGEILTNMEQEERNNNAQADPTITHTYPILLDRDWCSEKGLKVEEALCLDTTFSGNIARFINLCYFLFMLQVTIWESAAADGDGARVWSPNQSLSNG
ncbi:hypothetical protein R1sor_027555 [Riccia sorocarpa]|uniref:SET domain-containing protein n=1 Tax=Riccia sorocarpa TaxID=122646 RepID=A0ABD3GGA8_9MARC